MKELRTIIRDLREDHDLKQKTVASYLSVSQQTYSNYETGHRQIPTWVVASLARFYRVSSDYLLGTLPGYPGKIDLQKSYLDNISLMDVLIDIQKLKKADRQNLIKYIDFLLHNDTTKQ